MVRSLPRPVRRRGTAAVEFAVVLPFLMLLILGIWEVGRMVEVQNLLTNAAREGARFASAGHKTTTEIQQAAVQYLNQNGIAASTDMVTVTNLTSGKPPEQADQLDHLRISVTIPFNLARWAFVTQITAVTNLNGTADWYSMKDAPLTVNTVIPPG
jgi:Flp pilus assembly protein TadG